MIGAQIPLPLPVRAATGRADFFVSQSNALALALLDQWPNWPSGRLCLVGPEGSGKSHLAAIWAQISDARTVMAADLTEDIVPDLAAKPVVIEGADRPLSDGVERALFHLYNMGQGMLVTGRAAPATWSIRLPDLASRLQSVNLAKLEAPDDALISALLVKLFADRQITVTPNLIQYVLPRMERSFAAAQNLVAALDARSMASQQPITITMARHMLDLTAPKG